MLFVTSVVKMPLRNSLLGLSLNFAFRCHPERAPLRAYTNGQSDVTVSGANISETLTDLTSQYPALKPHLFNDGGELRPFVNLFVGENNIKDLQGVDTPVKDGEKIMLIPSIAGGSSSLRGRQPEAISQR
jgi:molybdopterin converting factor small subunit